MDVPIDQSYFKNNTHGLLPLNQDLEKYLSQYTPRESVLLRQTLATISSLVPLTLAEITSPNLEQLAQALQPDLSDEFTPIKETFALLTQQKQQLEKLQTDLTNLEKKKVRATQEKENLEKLPTELQNKKQIKETELNNIKNTIAHAVTLNAALDLLSTRLDELKQLSPEKKLDITEAKQAIINFKNQKTGENYDLLNDLIKKIITLGWVEQGINFIPFNSTFAKNILEKNNLISSEGFSNKRTELEKQLEVVYKEWRILVGLEIDEISLEQELGELKDEIEEAPKELLKIKTSIQTLTQKITETTQALSEAQTKLEKTLQKTKEDLAAVKEHFTPSTTRSALHLQAKENSYKSVVFYSRWKRGATAICLLSAGFLGFAIAARLGKLSQLLQKMNDQQNFLSRVSQSLRPYIDHFTHFTTQLEPLTFSAMAALPFVLSIGPRLILAEKEDVAAFHAFAELLNYKQCLEIETRQEMLPYPALRVWAEQHENMPSAVKRQLQTWIPDLI
ncbi:MAG: hypothetical protein JSR80_00525 [Verrucomicrobia bacterium]|nr:hypothetical protein [Verrucomicrobiota bacterium]